jgi:hypothetical protein
MSTPRRRIIRPNVNVVASNHRQQQRLQKQRQRLESERAALARWMAKLKRAFHSVERLQGSVARLERKIMQIEPPTRNGEAESCPAQGRRGSPERRRTAGLAGKCAEV